MNQQLNINFNNIPQYIDLSNDDKLKFKTFLISIIKLKRDTLKLINNVKDINENELPHYIFDINKSIKYSVIEKSWIFNNNKFNPTIPNGLINFLKEYNLENIINGADILNNDILDTFEKYNL